MDQPKFTSCKGVRYKKYALPAVMLAIFETVAVSLWLTKDNLFYLLNFSYIGTSIALGVFLYIREYELLFLAADNVRQK